MNTLSFGWSWQIWTEDSYPGPHWEFWMKVCPLCYRGPLTGKSDSVFEFCEEDQVETNCEYCVAVIDEDEVQMCEYCLRDGLGNCCIGDLDHECSEVRRRS